MLGKGKFVAYYRVSTDKQGLSGLGLEVQLATVANYAARNGGDILASFQEVESGKRSDRPELLKALAFDERQAWLCVARKMNLPRFN